jgi:hypothetical protein
MQVKPQYAEDVSVRSSWTAKAGTGGFHVLAFRCKASREKVHHSLHNETTRLSARWKYMLTPGEFNKRSPSLDFAGIWLELTPRFGHDRLLDITAAYAVDCYYAFMMQETEYYSKAYAAAIEALQGMRVALSTPTNDPRRAVPISLTILFMAEVCRREAWKGLGTVVVKC